MTLQGFVPGIPQTERVILTTTGATVLLEAGENGNFVHTVFVAETTGNNTTVIIDAFDGTTAHKITGAHPITASLGIAIEINQRLEPGWSIRATASAANRLHTHLTHSLPT